MRIPISIIFAHLYVPAVVAATTRSLAAPTPMRLFRLLPGRPAVPTPARLFEARISGSATGPVPAFTPFRASPASVAGIPGPPVAVPAPNSAPFGAPQAPAAGRPTELLLGTCKLVGSATLSGDPRKDCVPEICFLSGGRCVFSSSARRCLQRKMRTNEHGELVLSAYPWSLGGSGEPCTGCKCKVLAWGLNQHEKPG